LYETPSMADPRFAKLILGKKGIKEVLAAFKVDLSEKLIDLLSGMLEIDPMKRFTIQQVLEHPFLSSLTDEITEQIESDSSPVSVKSNSEIHPKVSGKVRSRSAEAVHAAKQLNCQRFKNRLDRDVIHKK